MTDLTNELNLLAGVGSLVLAAGTLWHGAGRRRNQLFALLCVAVAVWNLGVVGNRSSRLSNLPWNQIFLLGSCFVAPLGLHLSMVLVSQKGPLRRRLLPTTYLGAALLWLTSWLPFYDSQRQAWNLAALAYSTAVFGLGLLLLFRQIHRLPAGAERNAYRLLLGGTAVAVAGGLSDFLSRERFAFPQVGVLFLLSLMLLAASVLVRHRFLDVNVFLTRTTALLIATAMITLLYLGIGSFWPNRPAPIFLATLAVLALVIPLGGRVLARTARLPGRGDPLAGLLMSISRRLPTATSEIEIWETLESGRNAAGGQVELFIYLDTGMDGGYEAAGPVPGNAPRPAIPASAPLVRLASTEQDPITRRYLRIESQEAGERRRKLAHAALRQMDDLQAEVIVSLRADKQLQGWIGAGGGIREENLTAEIGAALLAVGNQTVASLERIEALENARRNEALAATGQLAAGLAHEIRNPVAAIRGAAEVLESEKEAEPSREMLEVIAEETGRLDRVIGEFLDYARPGSPRGGPASPGDLVRHAVRGAGLAGREMRTEIHVEPGTPLVTGDGDQLLRAMENLIRNAREAAGPEGTLKVDIRRAPTGEVALRFEDNGPGIPALELSKIFRPFHTTKPGGTGLGLALVHRIVHAHGGDIRVEGRPGQGAVFTLLLPAAGE